MSGERTALLPRVAAGDAAAVDLVLERYGSLVWSLATRGLRDRASAEDAVQEIFLDVWRSAGRFDPARGAEAVFVATIARRRIADAQRKRSRGPVIIDEAAAPSLEIPIEHDAFAQLANREEAERAMKAFDVLVPEQRRVLLMSIHDGLSHSQIAERSGLALGTVKSYVRRGLARVAEALQRGRRESEVEAKALPCATNGGSTCWPTSRRTTSRRTSAGSSSIVSPRTAACAPTPTRSSARPRCSAPRGPRPSRSPPSCAPGSPRARPRTSSPARRPPGPPPSRRDRTPSPPARRA